MAAAKAAKVTYTYTDEAPMLATHAFYPIIKAFCLHADVPVELKDISVAGRVIAIFPDYLSEEQKMSDILSELGQAAQRGVANIIKLPNISASVPQLKECIKELQSQGFQLPEYPEEPKDDKEKEIKARYARVLGSAVNPVLREGNSDRRAAVPVKEYAFRYPHSMGKWEADSKTHVSCMSDGDFYAHEKSVCVEQVCDARIELVAGDGSVTVLKEKMPLQAGEVLDSSFMNCKALCNFFEEQIQDAKAKGVLFSLHLKATMMKISDPIMFGHCVKVYFKDVFAKYAETFAKLGVNANNGLGDVYKKIAALPEEERKAIEADIMATYERRGEMAMVDSHRGITNLHVPSDIIIDNSMPTAIRAGGKMWNKDDKEADFKATIPDRGYGLVFNEVVEFCKKNGAFDPKTMGACPNVGLMAQKAEEYGSHPTTFEAPHDGVIRIVVNGTGEVLMGHQVSTGDIWRACFTKDAPIKDWVRLAVARCRANNFPNNDKPCKAIFWLDPARAHDVLLMEKVQRYLPEFDTSGLDIEVMSPVEAMRVTCQRAKEGLNTITVTGNVLRDYLTDLFPILELGTSAKMLSIVPMLAGGGMYETGAGGSAPKHVQQFQKEGHLRWDSLGEYLALACSIADLAEDTKNDRARALASALDKAVGTFLVANKNPSRKVKEIDNRGSHYWLARFWAEELAKQQEDAGLRDVFAAAAKELAENEETVLQDLLACQGKPVDVGGYYRLDKAKADAAMNPSAALNAIIARLEGAKKPTAKKATKVTYTYTDEAPMLATHAFYPIIKSFCHHAGVPVELKDISVAGRVIANFSDCLPEEQKMSDIMSELGQLAQQGQANIIKLPNISASVPQLKECIKELQSQGYKLPEYPEEPKDDKEKEIKARYAKVLGSAVNPVLREGNSDRRAAVPVKEYAFRYPHSMGKWEADSKTHVSCMSDGDFYSHEKSVCVDKACDARIEHVAEDGSVTILKEKVPLQAGEVVDSSFMNCAALCKFFEEQIQDAKEKGVLFSLHLKATMMKISDPIMFGHCVKVYFKDVFAKYADTFAKLGVDANNGLGDVYKKIAALPAAEKSAIEADIMATYERRGQMAMVDSDRGITNLHVPSDIIIDNSMPTAIRGGGKMWDADGKEADFKATIPDRGYGLVFKEVVEFCRENGAFDPKTMGACPNVGLMAQKAEEYGSHPTTFEPKRSGVIRIVVNGTDKVLMGHSVSAGDIWRACFTKDAPIKDWVRLAVARCRANNFPNSDKPCKAIFWLDPARAHDVLLMEKVQRYLPEFDTSGLDIEVMSPVEAMRVTCQRAKEGLNTITVTGNVLRDYLTDLFPIMELGTSAKMLSIVPMLAGGGMYETGAGGSAPKHVQQMQKEGHLRWDSLGEYLALACSIADLAEDTGNSKAKVLATALDKAVGTFLVANKNPSRKVKQIDNRGSHYWLARYWAEELAKQEEDASLKGVFGTAAKELAESEGKILQDLLDCQGKAVDLGGYYRVDKAKADSAMCPSTTLNGIIARLEQGPDARA